jgi:hypothetical protein
MSEAEVKSARMDVERSVADFERSLDRLVEQFDSSMGGLDVKERLKEFVNVDAALGQAKEIAGQFLSNLRENAEEEFRKLDKKPLITWGAFLASGLALGYVLAKRSASHRDS